MNSSRLSPHSERFVRRLTIRARIPIHVVVCETADSFIVPVCVTQSARVDSVAEFIAALTANETNEGVCKLIETLVSCSEESDGCDGCNVRRACRCWWDERGVNSNADRCWKDLEEWNNIIAARKDPGSPAETPGPAPTQSPRSAAAIRST